ncbi:hypothetical protein [Clostridium butyricum]|uniref:hypothetical protein n=1 Tax=Clostridium butyricum TaxID=1492 RepID=UPI0018AC81B5|nr:hypothetical protein [Clostridium butyricum]MDB2157879.1 hypothetical protein [Clostridium butyricum]
MRRENFELLDKVLNPFWGCINLLVYLIVVPVVALGVILVDISILNGLSITYNTLSNLNDRIILNIILFIVGNVIFVIIINELFLKITKKLNINSEYESIYNFVYELIDNTFKCLSFIAALVQINNLYDENISVESKVYVIFFFTLIIGIQQFIFKSWFKSIRNLGEMNFTQNIYEMYKFHRIKKNLKEMLEHIPEQVSNQNKKKVSKQLEPLFKILYHDSNKKTFENLGKKDMLIILEDKDLKEYEYFLNKAHGRYPKDLNIVVKQLKELKEVLK